MRLLLRSADPADLPQAVRQLRAGWTQTIERLRAMPRDSERQRVDGEWSAVETRRHLVFVHDSWSHRCCLGSTEPFTAIGLASESAMTSATTPSSSRGASSSRGG